MESKCDVLIVGGGTGGCAAAMAAVCLGMRVIMTEETDWIGGQLTAQIVPPDEHRWIEGFGCTQRYRQYREQVRQYYRDHYPLLPASRSNPRLNPGEGWVSRLCHEPKVGLAVLNQMLQFAQSKGLLEIKLRCKPVNAIVEGDYIRAVACQNLETGHTETINADYILDATEWGDLLPMAGVEYVTGSESQSQTGEPHASDVPMPHNSQGITWCFAMSYDPQGEHVIEKPAQYEKWKAYHPDFWPNPLLDWHTSHPITHEKTRWVLLPEEHENPYRSMFTYRRILSKSHFAPQDSPEEITVVNWAQNDYFAGNLIDVPEDIRQERLEESRQLSLSLFYWLQTEAPHMDGSIGYPGLRLRPDVTGTVDGLAKYPYVRESRRIQAMFTVKEQHVAADLNPGAVRMEPVKDSVGVGCYRIDIHPCTGGVNSFDVNALPFQIPLGSLLPVRVRNLLPACKNLGVTHITNGCYRLHPVEWNIGESAGLLAAFCLTRHCEPKQVYEDGSLLQEFQRLLTSQGVEIDWHELRPV